MGQLVEVQVPDIGDFKDVEVIEVLVKPGDAVAKEQSLITVESDKASMEIPSSAAGIVKELRVKLGDKVAQGSLVLVLEAGDGAAAPARAGTGTRGQDGGESRRGTLRLLPLRLPPRRPPDPSKSSCPTSVTSRTSR